MQPKGCKDGHSLPLLNSDVSGHFLASGKEEPSVSHSIFMKSLCLSLSFSFLFLNSECAIGFSAHLYPGFLHESS